MRSCGIIFIDISQYNFKCNLFRIHIMTLLCLVSLSSDDTSNRVCVLNKTCLFCHQLLVVWCFAFFCPTCLNAAPFALWNDVSTSAGSEQPVQNGLPDPTAGVSTDSCCYQGIYNRMCPHNCCCGKAISFIACPGRAVAQSRLAPLLWRRYIAASWFSCSSCRKDTCSHLVLQELYSVFSVTEDWKRSHLWPGARCEFDPWTNSISAALELLMPQLTVLLSDQNQSNLNTCTLTLCVYTSQDMKCHRHNVHI